MDIDPEHTVKTGDWIFLNGSRSSDLNSVSSFSVTEYKSEGRKSNKQAASEGGCSKDLTKQREETGGNWSAFWLNLWNLIGKTPFYFEFGIV